MQTTELELSKLVHPEKNVRVHSENQIKEFKRSIEQFGQIRPIVVSEDNTILAGNGLVQALRDMGKEKGHVLIVKNLSENDKKKLMLADNKVYSLGYDDNENIYDVLKSLDGDYNVPGYDDDLLGELLQDDDGTDEIISGYGVITPEEKDTFDRANENLDRKTEQAEQTQNEVGNTQAPQQNTPTEETTEVGGSVTENNERTDIERHIECPHCGEKVWL